MRETKFHEDLKKKADEYAHLVYKLTKQFPAEEKFGIISQIRRAALSVILNYIEGYARSKERDKVYKNFIEVAYGSLKESKYLLHFSLIEGFISREEYSTAVKLAEDIGAMLWGILRKL